MPLTLIKRLVLGIPLTPAQEDLNKTNIETYVNGQAALLAVALNPDGTIKNNAVATAAIQNRAVTVAKRAFDSNFYAVDTGAVNAIAVSFTPAMTAYAAGSVFYVKVIATNTGATTMNVDGVGARNVKVFTSTGLNNPSAGNLVANGIYEFVDDGTQLILLNPTLSTATVVSGTQFLAIPVLVYSGGVSGWVTYDASAVVTVGAKAVILQCVGFWNSAVDGEIITEIRKDNASNNLVLNDTGGTDAVRSSSQGHFPVTAARTFDYRVTTAVVGTTSEIKLIGFEM